uniref:Uncharacterized protein n=1 Tax=Ditylenchus dipsaci TaxID=166011 RepID=A0A915E9L3_9BILA
MNLLQPTNNLAYRSSMASDEEDENPTAGKRTWCVKKKRGNYTVEYKLETIEWGSSTLSSLLQEVHQRNRARIQNWTKQKTKLQRQE